MNIAVLRMNKTGKQYDLDMDYFIIDSLAQKNLGYKNLFRLVKEKNNPHIVDDTFNRHIQHLLKSGWIDKDAKYAPYCLTEKCKQEIKFGTLVLVPPKLKAIKPSTSAQLAIKKIHANILLLLFKSGSSYEFSKIEELEYFLSLFGLSTNSFHGKLSSDALHKSKDEVYKLELVVESDDGKFSVNKKRYVSSPYRARNSVSYGCNIKGIKYPIAKYRSDPFRKMGITQVEIKNTLSLLSNENILQKPVDYLGDSIYLVVDIRLYDLLFLYSYLYGVCRSTLKELWNRREPTPEEIQWVQTIEGDSKVARFIARAKEKRKKRTYYKRQIRITDLINKIEHKKNIMSKEKKYRKSIEKEFQDPPKPDVQEPTTKQWIEKEFQELRSNPKYHIIISEIEKFAFPNWFQRIKKKLR
jgi:hypothetical protein